LLTELTSFEIAFAEHFPISIDCSSIVTVSTSSLFRLSIASRLSCMKDAVAGLMICRIGGRSRLASCEKHMQFRKIDIVEVDDIISYHDVVTAETGEQRPQACGAFGGSPNALPTQSKWPLS